MVDIEIDGIYCPKCRELHPVLYWHNKYDEYLVPDECYESYKKMGKRFGVLYSDEECRKRYQEELDIMKIKLMQYAGTCVVCSAITNFADVNTEKFVCSNECLSKSKEHSGKD